MKEVKHATMTDMTPKTQARAGALRVRCLVRRGTSDDAIYMIS